MRTSVSALRLLTMRVKAGPWLPGTLWENRLSVRKAKSKLELCMESEGAVSFGAQRTSVPLCSAKLHRVFNPKWSSMLFGGHVMTETLFKPSERDGARGGTTQSSSALARTKASPPVAVRVNPGTSPISPPKEWLRYVVFTGSGW